MKNNTTLLLLLAAGVGAWLWLRKRNAQVTPDNGSVFPENAAPSVSPIRPRPVVEDEEDTRVVIAPTIDENGRKPNRPIEPIETHVKK